MVIEGCNNRSTWLSGFCSDIGGIYEMEQLFEIADYNNIFVTNLLSCKRTQNVKKKDTESFDCF